MVANPSRRTALADAAVSILGGDGARALTHRAVDRAASLPLGTCANYFPRRSALLLAAAERTFERLAPDADRSARVETAVVGSEPGAAVEAFVADVVARLLTDPDAARCLVELRLEASRSPEVRDLVGPVLRGGLDADVSFHTARGLPGGSKEVVLLHHLVNGIVLDALTVPIDPDEDPAAVARDAVQRIIEE